MKKIIILIAMFAVFALSNEPQTFNCRERLVHFMTFKVHQTTYTLNPFEHIKNSMNDVQFEVPVDEAFYNSGNGSVSGNFKVGSLLFNGDLSKLNVTIVGKRTARTGEVICEPASNAVQNTPNVTKPAPPAPKKPRLGVLQQKRMDEYMECRKTSGVGDCIRSGVRKEKCMARMEQKCGPYPEFK